MKKLTVSEIRGNPRLMKALSDAVATVSYGEGEIYLFVRSDALNASIFSEFGDVVSALCVVIPSETPWTDSRPLENAISDLQEQRRFETGPRSSAQEPLPEPEPASPSAERVAMIAGNPVGAAKIAGAKTSAVAQLSPAAPAGRVFYSVAAPPHASKRPVLDIVGERDRAAKRAAEARAQRKTMPPQPPPPPPAPPKQETPSASAPVQRNLESVLRVMFRDDKSERCLFSGDPADFKKTHIAGLGKGDIRYELNGELVDEFEVNIFIEVCQLWDTPRGVAFRKENRHLVNVYPAFRKGRKKLREIVRPNVESRAPGFFSKKGAPPQRPSRPERKLGW